MKKLIAAIIASLISYEGFCGGLWLVAKAGDRLTPVIAWIALLGVVMATGLLWGWMFKIWKDILNA